MISLFSSNLLKVSIDFSKSLVTLKGAVGKSNKRLSLWFNFFLITTYLIKSNNDDVELFSSSGLSIKFILLSNFVELR